MFHTMRLKKMAVAVLAAHLATSASAQQVDLSSGSVVETVSNLKAGEYVWAPQVAPDGPMLLIVNLKTQRAVLYRNGVPIGATTVSTGKPGHSTPTGVFTILQKQIVHYSSKYDSAPMPYMERLTWYGVALHAGHLPGYPASHGCIRMPKGFAQLLYGVTGLGMTVVIANLPAAPRIAPTPGLVSSSTSQGSDTEALSWDPAKSLHGPVSVIVSAADHRAVVIRNGVVIGSATVSISGPVSGTWAYSLRSMDAAGQHWVRIELSGRATSDGPVTTTEWDRFSASDAFKSAVARIVQPGMTIVVTSESLRTAAAPVTLLEG